MISIVIFQQILENNKNTLQARLMIAECLFQLKSFDEAIKAFNIVLKNDPYNINARYHLGQCYFLSFQYVIQVYPLLL